MARDGEKQLGGHVQGDKEVVLSRKTCMLSLNAIRISYARESPRTFPNILNSWVGVETGACILVKKQKQADSRDKSGFCQRNTLNPKL